MSKLPVHRRSASEQQHVRHDPYGLPEEIISIVGMEYALANAVKFANKYSAS